MKLELERPLLFFDIESTGLNIATDGIIELSFVKVFPDGRDEVKTWKIKPWDYENMKQIPIDPGASAVNGVKDEDLVDCPRFIEVVPEVAEWLRDSDLAGFNSSKFDLPLLVEEIERVRAYCRKRLEDRGVSEEKKAKARQMLEETDLDLHSRMMVDVQTIYHYMEPRNLRAAYRFYCGGKDFDNAHTAEADTVATYEVLKAQLDMYQKPDETHTAVLQNNVKALSEVGGRPRVIDFAGRLCYKGNTPTINFGKYRGESVKAIFERDKSYFSWIENGQFTLDTKEQFRKLYEKYDAEEKAARAKNEAAKSKPLTGKDLSDAADLLKSHFGGK